MRRTSAALLLSAAVVAGCGSSGHAPTAPAARVERTGAGERVVLSAQAAARLGIRTTRVVAAGRRTLVPDAAVLYAADGRTFTYTSPAPRVYVREPVRIDRVAGSRVFLASGPPAGSTVVTTGAPELLGAETGVQGESH